MLKEYFINERTIDCKNKPLCSYIVNNLQKFGIANLDLGPFQINYQYHSINPLEDYFTFTKSYNYACSYIEKLIKKYGFNWYAIASYHSKTKKYNSKYQKKLKFNFKTLQKLRGQ